MFALKDPHLMTAKMYLFESIQEATFFCQKQINEAVLKDSRQNEKMNNSLEIDARRISNLQIHSLRMKKGTHSYYLIETRNTSF